jgi:hypothetical protein
MTRKGGKLMVKMVETGVAAALLTQVRTRSSIMG